MAKIHIHLPPLDMTIAQLIRTAIAEHFDRQQKAATSAKRQSQGLLLRLHTELLSDALAIVDEAITQAQRPQPAEPPPATGQA